MVQYTSNLIVSTFYLQNYLIMIEMRVPMVYLILGVHYSVAQNTGMFIMKDILFVMVWENIYGMFLH